MTRREPPVTPPTPEPPTAASVLGRLRRWAERELETVRRREASLERQLNEARAEQVKYRDAVEIMDRLAAPPSEPVP